MLATALLVFVATAVDGKPVTQVVDAYPVPSPDGKTLLFQSNRNGRTALWTSAIDGTGVKLLLDSGDDPSVAAWSPDGRRIAFCATVEGDQPDIFVMDADGTNRKRLTEDPGDDSHPHWSGDGTRIFFNSARTTPDRKAGWFDQWHEIFSMRADGSDVRQHTHCRSVCTFGSPSPDGRRIAYRKVVATPGFDWALAPMERNSEVFVANADGSDERNLSNSAAFDGWPAWSPDGTRIAFASNRAGPANVGQLYVAGVDDGTLVKLSDGPSHAQPAWTRDGKSIFAYRLWEGQGYEFGGVVRVELSGESPDPR